MKNLIEKITLGTVQFGLDYGIDNPYGKPTQSAINTILNCAKENNINKLDTAEAYGCSQETISEKSKDFDIISKLHPNFTNVANNFKESLNTLNLNSVYGYMYHNFESFLNNKSSYNTFINLKEEGKIKKIGFSVYHPHEIEFLFNNNYEFDIVQLPYNFFDRRFEYLFPELKEKGTEIHTRSIFLQGLFFKNSDNLPSFFNSIKNKIETIYTISKNYKCSIAELCLHFGLNNPFIDQLVIGINSLENLKENIEIVSNVKESPKELFSLKVENETIILPYNWKI